MNIKISRLRTGAAVSEPLVTSVTITLRHLLETDQIAFYEAVMMARQPGYVPFGNTAAALHRLDFIDIYPNLHDTIRDVILASVEGDALSLHMISPFGESGAAA